jgi:hypothetical protein
MEIIQRLYIKRFCLPSDVDMHNFDHNQINACLCGNFNHVACIFKGKQSFEKGKHIMLWSEHVV